MKPNHCATLLVVLGATSLISTFAATVVADAGIPGYRVDPYWPKPLPNNWILGQIGGIATDRHDHIWVYQRPRSLTDDEKGAATEPPTSKCCKPAPPVLQFDAAGNLLQAWGGEGQGYDWPRSEHGIFVDANDHVWVAGNDKDHDAQVLEFTREGKFVGMIGKKGARMVDGKAVALIEFLPGVSPSAPTAAQARAVGAALAQVHLAARDFAQHRADRLTPAANLETLRRCGAERLAAIHPELPAACALAQDVAARWPGHLPRSIIHSDLFPDNVLMLGERVTGFIDFYFACDGMMAYDLAVTHAAWSFDLAGGRLSAPIGAALLEGYETVRPLDRAERAALPLLAEGACLRFTASRAEDWLEPPAGAQVTRKDPMAFLRRWQCYRELGAALFAKP